MKSINWSRPLGELSPDDEIPALIPEVEQTVERPRLTEELRERTRKSTETQVLRAMSRMYAPYTRRDE